MKYSNVIQGEFVSRPNRFVARVRIGSREETVHVKNTGRCKELLLPGARVILSICNNPNRKTKYDLIAVYKERESGALLINMDSQIPNDAVFEWIKYSGIFSEKASVRREVTFGNSRFDLSVTDGGRRALIEVKGVTLEKEGIAMFPDAPTERGIKHVCELIRAVEEGFEAYLIFVIQMKQVKLFRPNTEMHKEFSDALLRARDAGVHILAMDCVVSDDCISIDSAIPIQL